MLKVMCIAEMVQGRTPRHLQGKKFSIPQIGDICTVTETNRAEGLVFYTLLEYGDWHEFDSRAFAILPDASADEMKEETREAIVNIENQPA